MTHFRPLQHVLQYLCDRLRCGFDGADEQPPGVYSEALDIEAHRPWKGCTQQIRLLQVDLQRAPDEQFHDVLAERLAGEIVAIVYGAAFLRVQKIEGLIVKGVVLIPV
jgi:hypothetical protein